MAALRIDEQLAPSIPSLPKFSFSDESVVAIRAAFNSAFTHPPSFTGVRVEEHMVPGPKGAPDVHLFTYHPNDTQPAPLPAFYWIHGGGHVMGSATMDHARMGGICKELGIVVASVNYRYAPENRFPAGIEDCYAGVKWIHDNAGKLGVDANKIAVGGMSAGGGLAASLALLARDRNEFKFVFQVLIYPMLDDRTILREHKGVGELVWTLENSKYAWQALLGDVKAGSDAVSPYAAPMRAQSLKDLPPAYIPVGELDIFREESIVYAQRLWDAGVSTELHIIPGAFHAFDIFAPEAFISKSFEEHIKYVLKRALLKH